MKPPQGQLFKPGTHRGGWICLGVGATLLAVAAGLVITFPGRPVSAALFWVGLAALVSIVAGGYALYRAATLFLLQYTISRNGLEVDWGVARLRVPMSQIETIAPLKNPPDLPERRLFGVPLPNWWLGRWRGVDFYAPAAGPSLVVETTSGGKIVLSPATGDALVAAWQLRLPLGATRHWRHEIIRRGWWGWPLWFDPLARWLGIGAVLLTLILVGAFFVIYPSLPAAIPIGQTIGPGAAIASKRSLLWIPASGTAILLLNLLLGAIWYRKDRVATYLFWFLAMVVQVGLWLGVRMVVG